jgi:DNA-binding PadR family transcriptional regulator
LRKLTEEGFIEKLGTEQEGSRPSRTVYQITGAGREEFLRLLRQVWDEVERQYYAFDIGLTFMSALPIEEVKAHLRGRVKRLEHTIQHVEAHQAEQLANVHVPPNLTTAVFDHHLLHFNAELDWTRDLLEKVEQGAYDAELGWMRGLLEQTEPGDLF